MKTKQQWEIHKKSIMAELAKLEELNWTKNDVVADSVFPYVLIEAINLLKNSEIVENPVDYAETGEKAQELINSSK